MNSLQIFDATSLSINALWRAYADLRVQPIQSVQRSMDENGVEELGVSLEMGRQPSLVVGYESDL